MARIIRYSRVNYKKKNFTACPVGQDTLLHSIVQNLANQDASSAKLDLKFYCWQAKPKFALKIWFWERTKATFEFPNFILA